MNTLCVYTLFNNSKPTCCGIRDNNNIKIIDLYKPNTGLTIKKIKNRIEIIKNIILNANSIGRPTITSNFKKHLECFNFEKSYEPYNIYDIHLPNIEPSKVDPHKIIASVLESMSKYKIREYNRIIANSATVYRDLQENGLLLNHTRVFPIWSQDTFSGRSKSTGFNIQGYFEQDFIRPTLSSENSVLIHFDWICADIRMASILSGDNILNDSFINSDPYTHLMNILNSGSDKITREECKRYLLKSINSMDFMSDAFQIYPELGKWLYNCAHEISNNNTLRSILGRKFHRRFAKNDFSVLNGIMQGSVVHAMQIVIRKIWESLPNQIIAEIHDSLVMCADNDLQSIKHTIDTVSKIMLYPFEGILDTNYIFPLKISIGRKWKSWKLYKEIRNG